MNTQEEREILEKRYKQVKEIMGYDWEHVSADDVSKIHAIKYPEKQPNTNQTKTTRR